MIRTFSAYLDFYYLVRRPAIDEDSLASINEALERFYRYRVVFQTHGVRPPGPIGFSLPRQHAIKHYPELIIAFGAPNGLCSSLTEKKHIQAVKKPWRRSGRHRALGQVLLTNQRLDKLRAARRDFCERGMLTNTCLGDAQCAISLDPDPPDDPHGRPQAGTDRMEIDRDAGFEGGEHDRDQGDESEDEEDDDDWAPVPGPTILNHVVLSRSKGASNTSFCTGS
jgi:hypothetical protein